MDAFEKTMCHNDLRLKKPQSKVSKRPDLQQVAAVKVTPSIIICAAKCWFKLSSVIRKEKSVKIYRSQHVGW